MKLPSISKLLNESGTTFLRFPLTITLASIASIISIYIIEHERNFDNMGNLLNLIHTCTLGISFSIAAILISERLKFDKTKKILVQVATILLLAGYYFYLPEKVDVIHIIRALLLALAFHCLVAFAPFFKKNELNGFWQFNKTIFIQFLLSTLYTGVLYFGISMAILAINHLFKANIDGKVYAQLWFLLAGIFNTWFFLNGIPQNIEELNSIPSYPKGLKIFTQYVLLPLVTFYLLILYVYLFKIILEWQLPLGWVSYLVLCFSITGIFSLLLIYPLQNSSTEKWIKIYSKWFYYALFPLIILLFTAIVKRVSEYGITENRYFILILAFWLTCIAIYLLINRLVNIKIIPITLGFIALFSSFGPWGAFSISKNSQLSRFETILNTNKMLINGKIKEAPNILSDSTRENINSIINYICNMHGYSTFKPYFTQDLDAIAKKQNSRYLNYEIQKLLGTNTESRYGKNYDYFSFYCQKDSSELIDIKEYDYFLVFERYFERKKENEKDIEKIKKIIINKDSLLIEYNRKSSKFCFNFEEDSLNIDMAKFYNQIRDKYKSTSSYYIQQSDMIIIEENKKLKLNFVIHNINGEFLLKDKIMNINNLHAYILIKLKK